MSSLLYMLGRAAYRARSWVLAGNTFSIPGTESQEAQDSLARTFPEGSGTSAQLVAVAPQGTDVHDPAFQSAVESSTAAIAKIPQVTSASSPCSGPSTGNIAADGSAVGVGRLVAIVAGVVALAAGMSSTAPAALSSLAGALPTAPALAMLRAAAGGDAGAPSARSGRCWCTPSRRSPPPRGTLLSLSTREGDNDVPFGGRAGGLSCT